MYKAMAESDRLGFTLIELLVVIAILGTLAAVVVLNIIKYTGAGKNEAMVTERENVQTAVVAYMYDHPSVASFPATRISPANPGILTPYFITSLNCTYNIPAGGAVPNGTKCDGVTPVIVSPVEKDQPFIEASAVPDSIIR